MTRFTKITLILLLVLPGLALADQGSADSYGYMWTNSDGGVTIPYSWADLSGQTSIFGSSFDDSLSAAIPLPFSFTFYGTVRNQVYVSSNGWISFVNPGDTTYPVNDVIPAGGGPDAALAVFWDDLASTPGNNGGVYYKTIGSSPNRQFVVEWKVINASGEINFQVILFEKSNLIKYQYRTVGASYNGGDNATIGIKSNSSLGNQYSYNTPASVTSGDAVLFHNASVASLQAGILPAGAEIGSFEIFNYKIYNIDPAGAAGLGKIDHVTLTNPFSTTPSVIAVKINNSSALLQYGTTKPAEAGRATWYYSGGMLTVQTAYFNVSDSIVIQFGQTIPDISAGDYTYAGGADADIDTSPLRNPSTQPVVNITSGGLDYIVIRDAANQGGSVVTSRTLNTDQSLTLYAAGYDAADNYLGDQNATWTITGNLGGTGGSGTSFTFNPAVAPATGTIEADVGGIADQTGVITVNPGALSSLTIRTGANETGIIAGALTMTTGDSQTFWAAGYDTDNNYRGDEAATVWTSTLGISGSGASIDFSPVSPVTGTLTATVGAVNYTSGTITVNAGVLDHLIIRDAPNNGGSPVANRTLTTDQSLTLYAAGYDASDTYLGDRSVTWTVTGSLGGTGGSGSSYTFNPAVAPAFGTIEAETGGINTATGAITVNVGALASIVIRTGQNEGGSIVTTMTMTTDQSQTFWAAGYDADGNYRGDEASTVWTSTLGISGSGASIFFDPPAPISGTLTATMGAVSHTTGTITVNVGAISYLKIRNAAGGAGTEVTTLTMNADQAITVYAAAYDANNNFIADQTVDWSVTGSLDGTPQNSLAYTFSPAEAPTSGSIVARLGTSHSTSTGTITVNPGALATLQIRTAANNGGSLVTTFPMSTDQSQTFWAAGFDADGNYRGDEASTVWTSTLGISGNGSSITFSPAVPVSGTLTATIGPVSYMTGTITVSGGILHHIIIRDSLNVPVTNRALTADQQLKFFAAGFDAENNFLGNQTVNWTMTGSLDGPDQAGASVYIFKPVLAPASGAVTASIGDINAATGTISVSVGALDRISIYTTAGAGGDSLNGATLTTDQSLTMYALSFDADNNFISTVNATWSNTGNLDPVSGTGPSYTFSPATAPTSGTISATYNGKTDSSGLINVVEGSIHHITLRDAAGGAGNIVTTATLTADDSLMLYAAGYDVNNNYVTDVSATWFSTGSLDPISANGPSYKFLPVKAPASGTIGAQTAEQLTDFTEQITVNLGALSQIKITDNNAVEIGNITRSAGESLVLYSRGYDSDGNLRGLVNTTWGKTGTLDPVSATGTSYTFIPQTAPSSGKIYAAGSGFSDTTGVVTVISSGVLAKLRLRTQPGGLGKIYGDTTRTITADSSLTLYAAGYDGSDNYLGDYVVDWYSIPTTVFDIINASGSSYTYNPVKKGKGKIAITNGTLGTTTGEITVNFGSMFELVINDGPDEAASKFIPSSPLQAGQSITLYAAGYDQDGNWRGLVPAAWSTTGTLDPVSTTGTSLVFTPQTAPSSGTINAAYLTFNDITGTITVNAGQTAYIRIRNAAGGLGQIVADTAITADQTLTLYAAAYDGSDNYLQDLTVSWSSTGTLDQVVATAASYVFNPVHAPTSGTIRINSGSFSHQTGTISVTVGPLDHVAITNAAGAAGIPVDTYTMTADQILTLWAAAYDADSNYINNVPALWSQTGSLDTATATATSFTFSPHTAPTSGTIAITFQTRTDQTGLITVNPGSLFTVRINESPDATGTAVGAVALSVGQSLTLYAASYDQDGNWRGLENASWQTTPTLDAQSGVGPSFTFTPQTANTSGQIRASVGGHSDVTGNITVSQGVLTTLKIRTGANNTGIEFNGTTMTADDTLVLYAAGYDAGGNYLQDEIVTWSNGSGTLDNVSASGASLIFAPVTAPRSGTIKATSGSIVEETGVINVIPGLAYQIVDYNGMGGKRTTVAGSTQWIRVRVTDQHGNAVTGTTVNFSPSQRVSDPSDVTDADGLAETVFTTLADQDSATVTAAVTGLASFTFKVYGIRYISNPGINPKIVPRGATQSFTVTVSNPGDIAVPLSAASTNISFSGGTYSYTATLQSPTTLPARNMAIVLTFGAALINQEFPGGSYTPRIQLVGSGTFASMNGSIYTTPGELTIGSDQITIGIITIAGPSGNNEVLQGDKNITANLRVYNSGIPLSIDAFPATTVMFKMGGAIYPVDNLTRTDVLTTLPSNTESQLTFRFDLPANAQTGTVDVFGKLSLDNGNLPIEAEEPTGTMLVKQSGNATYVSGSLKPGLVVPNQSNVQLSAKFLNTGTANIVLNQAESTIEIVNAGIGPRTLISQFILIGTDTTEVFFNNMTIPSSLTPAFYNVRWHLKGTLPNGSAYDSTAVITNGIRVAAPANLRFNTIAVAEDTVRQGQSGISVYYTIRNVGASPGVITSLDHHFNLVGDGAVPANEWIPTDLDPALPFTLNAGQSRSFTAIYALIANATTGVVQPAPVVRYHDVLTPGVPATSGTVITNDQVVVIQPASIKITGLVALAPNAPYVNVNQTYNMRLSVLNNGADRIKYTDVDIFDNIDPLTPVITLRLRDIASGAPRDTVFSLSGTQPGQTTYTAVIDTAVDIIDNPVKPAQPDDRDEAITYQLPSSLSIDAQISSVWGAGDSLTTSVDQVFTVMANIVNSGESEFKEDGLGILALNLDSAYFALVDQQTGNTRSFTSHDTLVSWQVKSVAQTPAGAYQPISFGIKQPPVDKNTGQPVAVLTLADTIVNVRNFVTGQITSNQLTVSDPPGAADDSLSTLQLFTVHAAISFNSSVADEARKAQIILPSFEWELQSENDIINLPAGANVSAEWLIRAPDRRRGPLNILVVASGKDKYSDLPLEKESAPLPLQVFERANLKMSVDIVKRENVPGDTLSYGQQFDLTVLVTNSGEAAVKNSGRVYFEPIPELSYDPQEPGQQDTLDFKINETVSWKLITNDQLSKTAGQQDITTLIKDLNQEVLASEREGVLRNESSRRMNALSTAISDYLIQSFDRQTMLTLKMREIPDDENTDKDAYTTDSERTIPIYIQDKAKITISDPVVPDTVSTEQTFTLKVTVNTENNLQNPTGILELPEGFYEANGGSFLYTTVNQLESTCTWSIKAPAVDSYMGSDTVRLSFFVVGIDGNSNEEIYSSTITKKLTLQIHPKIWMNYEIVDPASLRETGEVSHGQQLELSVWAELAPRPSFSKLAYAELSSWGTISLDEALFTASGFQKVTGQNYSPNFLGTGERKPFIMRAPNQNRTAQMRFRFSKLPKDLNSGTEVAVITDSSTLFIPVSVVEKEITVTLIDTLSTGSTFTRGEGTHVLLAFNISNKSFQDPLFINRLSVRLIARSDTTKLPAEGVLNLIEWIGIMNEEAAKEYLKRPQAAKTYAELAINEENVTNPLRITFDQQIAQISGGSTENIAVMVRYRQGTSSRSFRAVLTGVNAYDSDPLYPVSIVDGKGVGIEDGTLATSPIGITSGDPERSFGNFPNPFGRTPHETTEIRFLLLENSDVTLRIFSLAGELVRSQWSRPLTNLDGSSSGSFYYITWDGTNDNGDRILNGVYLCVIQIKGVSGKSSSFMTKIAYIK